MKNELNNELNVFLLIFQKKTKLLLKFHVTLRDDGVNSSAFSNQMKE